MKFGKSIDKKSDEKATAGTVYSLCNRKERSTTLGYASSWLYSREEKGKRRGGRKGRKGGILVDRQTNDTVSGVVVGAGAGLN